MPIPFQNLSRFLMTYGLLFLLSIDIVLFAYRPLENHIITAQQLTSYKAKNAILGYQTPDFKRLSNNILNGNHFTSYELENYHIDAHYLPYLPFYEKASGLFPESFEMHYFKGVCYLWMGNTQDAKASLETALQINPTFFWTYYNLALLYLKEGQVAPAIKLLSYAQKLPIAFSEKAIFELQAFRIIWMYMPNPGKYIHEHLIEKYKEINNLQSSDIQQWCPIFF